MKIKESEKKNPAFISLSKSKSNVDEGYSGLRPILHPSFVEIHTEKM